MLQSENTQQLARAGRIVRAMMNGSIVSTIEAAVSEAVRRVLGSDDSSESSETEENDSASSSSEDEERFALWTLV